MTVHSSNTVMQKKKDHACMLSQE